MSDLPSLDIAKPEKKTGFDFDTFVFNYRKSLTTIFGGLILIGIGLILFKSSSFLDTTKVEILDTTSPQGPTLKSTSEIVVDISGSIEKPGVYKLQDGARIDDLLVMAGGVSGEADREWVSKNINRAAKLSDGQKLYIPALSEKSEVKSQNSGIFSSGNVSGIFTNGLMNINTASQKELESLPGIGPVYAQSIIEGRIYSSVEELLSRGILRKSTYEKIKDKVTIN